MTYPGEMFEEAERREREVQENIERAIELDKEIEEAARNESAERAALDALDRHYEENGQAFGQLAYIERWEREQEIEREYRKERILERYNNFYNIECSGLAHGTPITPEFQQAMTLECMLDALRYENLNHEFSEVQTADVNALIDGLYQQGKDYLERVKQ